jgi:lysozyme family protein
MADTFAECLAFTLGEEGGWSNNPRDPGGCTIAGVTLPSYQDWKQNHALTCNDLQLISHADISDFYQTMYWQTTSAQTLPPGVDLMVFDAAVNMGVSGSVKLLQTQVNVVADGDIGPITLAAVSAIAPVILVADLAQAQTVFYQTLSDFAVFGTGWLNRITARQTAAIAMLSTS